MAAETELQALVVKLQADLSSFKSEMLAGQKVVADSSRNMERAISEFSKGSKQKLFDFGSVANTALGVFSGEAILAGIRTAGDAVLGFAKTMLVDGVAAAEEAQAATNKLNQALAQSGQYSAKASTDLKEFASALEATTTFEDDAITGAQALMQSIGQLDTQGLKRGTRAALDMAAALGVDLHTAAMLVGKAAAGEIGTLSRYGITVAEGATKAETFARALDAINSKFGGSASAQVNTFAGATAQLSNSFGNFQEAIGSAVVENQTFIFAISEVNKIIKEFTHELEGSSDSIKVMVSEGFLIAIDATAAFIAALDGLGRIITSVIETGKASFYGLGAAISGVLSLVSDEQEKVFQHMSKKADEAVHGMSSAFSDRTILDGVNENLGRIRAAAATGFAQVKDGAEATVEPINRQRDALLDLTAAQSRFGEHGKKLADELLTYNPALVQKQQLEMLELKLAEHEITLDEYQARRAQLTADMQSQEMASLTAALEQKKISEEQYAAARIKLEESVANQKAILAKKQRDEDIKDTQEKLGRTSQLLGNMSAMMQSHNREIFEIGKAAAVAKAIIDGISAVQKTLAEGGFLAIPLAVSVAAMTAANVAKITSTDMKMATGGVVPGITPVGDQVPIMANSGEMFLNRQQQTRLFDMIDGGGGGQTPTLVSTLIQKIDQLSAAIFAQPVVVAVDGQTVFEAVRGQVRAGRALA